MLAPEEGHLNESFPLAERIDLVGKRRGDGSLFVTSRNMPPFNAVIPDGKWESVLQYLLRFLEVNFGPVKDLRLIRDASELMPEEPDANQSPPAYVIAQLKPEHARPAR